MLSSIDILGQQPGLTSLYTQISFCYSVTDESAYSTIVDKLTKGLEQLIVAFPWVAGKVEGTKIMPYLDCASASQLIKVKDYRKDTSVPTMDDYRKARFPIHMFDEAIVAPCKTISYFDFKNKESPVLLIQVNYIQGGLILTFNANHQVMDMIGQAEIMSLISKACHGESFTEEEIIIGNLDREHIIPLLSEEEQKNINIDHQIKKPSTTTESSPPPTPPSCQWANFIFEKGSLDQLKSIASKDLLDGIDFISTDDAMTAFIWQSITRARLPRLQQSKDYDLTTKVSQFARAIDVRKFLNIPSNFIGTIQNMTYHQYNVQELGSLSPSDEQSISLGHIASNLRLEVDPKTSTLKQKTRELATLLSITNDKSSISTTATLDTSTDIMLSSWAKVNCYSLDFNLGLGLPESVTRPSFVPVESLIYFLPKNLKGDVVVSICLRDDDMERLKNDQHFIKYGQYLVIMNNDPIVLASIDILGQQPSLVNVYTQISFCYSVTDESTYSTIVNKLTIGLERLIVAFPWVAGKVEDTKVIPYSDNFYISELITIKDYRKDTSVPTMDDYRKARFPIHMFDEAIVAPCKTISYFDFKNKESPVLLIQVNYIQGGLILTFNANHQVMDMIGQAEIMSLISKACHGESFTEEEIIIGNLDREHIIPLLSEEEQKNINIDHQIKKPSTTTESSPPPTPPSCQWANFIFEKGSLDQLKSIASKDLLDGIDFISTDDAMTAFIWQSITRARLPRLQQSKDYGSTTQLTKLVRAIDVRRYLNIPSAYPGMIQKKSYHPFHFQDLATTLNSLGHIASNLRLAIDPKTSTLGQKARELATLFSITKEKSSIQFNAPVDRSTDLVLSSWAKINCYSLDFNLGLGLPDCVIRPFFNPIESLIYFLPKNLKGDIVVTICLRDDDMERLKNDQHFLKYGQYIG
ncbi:unnamed protein product [Cunninghamella blakesleeana]